MEQLMSVEYMHQIRNINKKEMVIVEYLVKLANYSLSEISELFVMPLNDWGMGSFTIFQNKTEIGENRNFGKQISEYEFIDDDNVPVLVSLNVDENNHLFEVDIWKVNYDPVINLKLPSV